MKALNKIPFILIVTLLFGCTSPAYKKYEDSYLDYLDTFSTLIAYTSTPEEFDTYSAKMEEDLEYYDNLFNVYDNAPFNNLKTINDNAGKTAVVVDTELFELIKLSKDMYLQTEGTINIAMGSVLSVWHSYRLEGVSVPAIEELTSANMHTSIDNIVLDDTKKSVYIADENASIDLGAVAKGYISSLIAEDLKALGMTSGLINIGGNVVAVGKPSDKDYFKVAIQSPSGDNSMLDTLSIKDVSVITSGNYQRYYEVDGKRYHHIIDPYTLYPANNFKSVTVITADPTLGDMLSTALFILPLEDGEALAKKYNAQAMWVDLNDTVTTTEGYSQYSTQNK